MIIKLPQLPPGLEDSSDLADLIKSDYTLEKLLLQNEDIAGLRAQGFSVNESRLKKLNATSAKLEKTSFLDAELLHCDLIAISLAESSWQRVLIKSSRCSGMQLQTSTLKNVTFDDCKLNLANFRFSKLTNVRFKDCLLDEADFYAAVLKNVEFQNCVMNKTEFSGSELKVVDFRTSDIVNIANISSLAGASIDYVQLIGIAPKLAAELKIKVQ